MDTFNFTSSPLTTIRRASLETPTSVFKPATSSFLRRFSLTSSPQLPKKKKTVRFADSISSTSRQQPRRTLIYSLQTAYFFTAKDIKTILIPQTLFGLITAYATSHHASASAVLARTPFVLAWVSLNLLPFCIGNQRQPGAIAEDMINRPSRPLASKRLSAAEAYTWMMQLYCLAFIAGLFFLGGTSMCITLMVLGWLYNDCGLSERGIMGRNALTALGYAAFGVGAWRVAIPSAPETNQADGATYLWLWIAILAAVIGTTGQMTDMADLEGDRLRGRTTAPIVWGEGVAKCSIGLPVAIWSVVCPLFWHLAAGVFSIGFALPVALGGVIVVRLAMGQKWSTAAGYKRTNRLWNLWVAVLYLMPLFAA